MTRIATFKYSTISKECEQPHIHSRCLTISARISRSIMNELIYSLVVINRLFANARTVRHLSTDCFPDPIWQMTHPSSEIRLLTDVTRLQSTVSHVTQTKLSLSSHDVTRPEQRMRTACPMHSISRLAQPLQPHRRSQGLQRRPRFFRTFDWCSGSSTPPAAAKSGTSFAFPMPLINHARVKADVTRRNINHSSRYAVET